MAGIELDKIIPLLNILKVDNQTREELNKLGKQILVEKVRIRELKESIDDKIKEKSLDLYAGIDTPDRLPKPDPIFLDSMREEASNLLYKLIEPPKKEEVPEPIQEEEKVENNEEENKEPAKLNEEENKEQKQEKPPEEIIQENQEPNEEEDKINFKRN